MSNDDGTGPLCRKHWESLEACPTCEQEKGAAGAQARIGELESCLATERALYEAAKAEFKLALAGLGAAAESAEEDWKAQEKEWRAEVRELRAELRGAEERAEAAGANAAEEAAETEGWNGS